MPGKMTADKRQFIDGLRAVANFYEENPQAYYDGMAVTLSMYVWGRSACRTLIDVMQSFGQCATICDETHVTVSKRFSPKVQLAIFAARSKFCRRIIVGTRTEVIS